MDNPLHIARIGGLTGDAIEPLTSLACRRAVAAWRESAAQLCGVRQSLETFLFQAVHEAEPDQRRILLDLKRACFNGRPIEPFAVQVRDRSMTAALAGELELATKLEIRTRQAEENLVRTYGTELERMRAHLGSLRGHSSLGRGIALASPDLFRELGRVGSGRDRKARKAERSFVRYVTRAALKTSPYSTLTRVAIAESTSLEEEHGLQLPRAEWREVSLVRLKRFIVEQFFTVISRHPSVRRRLLLRLNNSLAIDKDGRFSFLKPLSFVEDENGRLQTSLPSHVRVRLSGPIIEHLAGWRQAPPMAYEALIAEICSGLGESDAESVVAETLDRLIEIGFLELLTPWSSHEIRSEDKLVELLTELEPSGPFREISEIIARLIERQDRFALSPDPGLCLRDMEKELAEGWEKVLAQGSREMGMASPMDASGLFYEDVFLHPSQSSRGAAVSLERTKAVELLQCGNSIWRIFSLFNPRLNFLLSLTAFWRSRLPDTSTLPFLSLFAAAQPLWRDYIGSCQKGLGEQFDPFTTPEMAELFELRQELRRELAALAVHRPDADPEDFARLAASITRRYDPLVGCTMFVQPADSGGREWVLNRLFEGTGRFSCRFTSALPLEIRSDFIRHFEESSHLKDPKGRIELLDILYGRENTANQHWPQTPKVLEIPGELSDLPSDRKLRLADLLVRLDEETGLPTLEDESGVRYLPCQMSAVTNVYMPVLVKFLASFGPTGYVPSLFPSWAVDRQDNGVVALERLTFGSLIFRRKRWIVPNALLPDRQLEPTVYFRELYCRMESLGLPQRVFWIEPIRELQLQREYKPQFLDFSSPLLVSLFQHPSFEEEGTTTFEEALPDSTEFPADDQGRRWVVEISLDSLVEGVR